MGCVFFMIERWITETPDDGRGSECGVRFPHSGIDAGLKGRGINTNYQLYSIYFEI